MEPKDKRDNPVGSETEETTEPVADTEMKTKTEETEKAPSEAGETAKEASEETGTEKGKDKEKDRKLSRKEQKELDALKQQLAEKTDQYLRLAAESDNFRKRSEKEKSDCYAAAYGAALAAFLPFTDSLYQAIQFSPDDEGIKALAKQNADILEKLGIKEMETDGKPFDPNLHNAIMHEENPDVGENTITQTFQKGYVLGEKVLRPAMVKVAN